MEVGLVVVLEVEAISVVELKSAVVDASDVVTSVGVGTSDLLVSVTSTEVDGVSPVVLSETITVDVSVSTVVVSGSTVVVSETSLEVDSDPDKVVLVVPKSVVDDSMTVVKLDTVVVDVASQISEIVIILVGASAVTVMTS